MYQDIIDFIVLGACDLCQHQNILRKAAAELHPIPVPDTAFTQWGMDTVGKLTTTDGGNSYLLVFTEYTTKWVEARAIPTKEAVHVADAVEDIGSRFGVMETIISNQGREFYNSINEDRCKRLGIKHHVTTAYHPQSNSLTERFNQTLCTSLVKYTNKRQTDWDRHLPPVLLAYRSAVQASTKHSPFYLVYGRQPKLPVELDFPVGATNTQPTEEEQLEQGVRRHHGRHRQHRQGPGAAEEKL
ncbi:hypothetical protein GJAV_G00015370 [Gymnothorax javanicus]|nr:hypothetical protein GJAV_G00015370 [Gymnothorax javanicus]